MTSTACNFQDPGSEDDSDLCASAGSGCQSAYMSESDSDSDVAETSAEGWQLAQVASVPHASTRPGPQSLELPSSASSSAVENSHQWPGLGTLPQPLTFIPLAGPLAGMTSPVIGPFGIKLAGYMVVPVPVQLPGVACLAVERQAPVAASPGVQDQQPLTSARDASLSSNYFSEGPASQSSTSSDYVQPEPESPPLGQSASPILGEPGFSPLRRHTKRRRN